MVKLLNRIKYFQKKDLERFFAQVRNRRDRALFALIYLYGLRISELTLLKLDAIDLNHDRIFIQRVKGGIGGEKPLFNIAKKLLLSYLKIR